MEKEDPTPLVSGGTTTHLGITGQGWECSLEPGVGGTGRAGPAFIGLLGCKPTNTSPSTHHPPATTPTSAGAANPECPAGTSCTLPGSLQSAQQRGKEQMYPNYSNCKNTSEVWSSGADIIEQTHWAALPWNTFFWRQCIWCNILVLQCPGSERLKLLSYDAYFHPSDWEDNQITLKPDQHSSSESYELSCFPLHLLACYLKSLNNILRNRINYFIERNFRKQERTRNRCREKEET